MTQTTQFEQPQVEQPQFEQPVVEPMQFAQPQVAPIDPMTHVGNNKIIEGRELEELLFQDITREEAQKTTKVNKFYTFNRKNEEFQKLLDEEYDKYQQGKPDGSFSNYVAEKNFGEDGLGETVPQGSIGEMEKARELFFENGNTTSQDETNEIASGENNNSDNEVRKDKKVKDYYDENDKGGLVGKIIIGVLFALILALVTILVIKFVAPTSAIAEMIDEFALKILEMFR